VVFATALGEERDKAKAFALGAVDYLVKPIQRETLLQIVARHLKTHSQWQNLIQAGAAKAESVAEVEKMLSRSFGQFLEYLADNSGWTRAS